MKNRITGNLVIYINVNFFLMYDIVNIRSYCDLLIILYDIYILILFIYLYKLTGRVLMNIIIIIFSK